MIKLIALYAVMTWLTWVLYVAVIALRVMKKRGTLRGILNPLGYATLAVGLLFDFALNILWTLPMLQLPRDWLLTMRLQRNINEGSWRGKQARWLCDTFLNPIDEGHCK